MKQLIVIACAVLSACGGSGTGAERQSQGLAQPTSLMFVGNSITVHPPEPSIGWTLDCGMASTDCSLDYVHLVSAGLGVPFTAENVAPLEAQPDLHEADIPSYAQGVTASTTVVVEMGDDVAAHNQPAFQKVYGELLSALQPRQALVCLSTWWGNGDTDAVIQAVCEAQGGAYVYIGDIFPTRTDTWPPNEVHGITLHPHDPSMAIIAERVMHEFR